MAPLLFLVYFTGWFITLIMYGVALLDVIEETRYEDRRYGGRTEEVKREDARATLTAICEVAVLPFVWPLLLVNYIMGLLALARGEEA